MTFLRIHPLRATLPQVKADEKVGNTYLTEKDSTGVGKQRKWSTVRRTLQSQPDTSSRCMRSAHPRPQGQTGISECILGSLQVIILCTWASVAVQGSRLPASPLGM